MSLDDFIANRIKELYRTQGISQYRLSQLTGISQTALSKIVRKKNLPTIITLEKICNGFQISLGQFIMGNEAVIDLTETQQEILSIWNELNPDERRIFLNFIHSIRDK